ncbi:MAG: mucoidy inhibitor-like protein [Ignavibacteria bacterium]|nr:MAG: mucoidy inhibitor-like protein [Ignavibacteria bacterium]KAF0161646.1 MAG: mucoidy inhibitor-like protein [Ignavibacteria bacterium]
MKRILIAVFALFIAAQVGLAAGEVIVMPNISNVKVFLRGAELKHSAKVKLEKGINEVVLTGIAQNIDRNSINVSGKGDGVIISVVQRFDYLRSPEKHPDVKVLEDSLELLSKSIAMKQNDADVLKYELDLILANKNIGNEKIGVSITELQKMADFFRKRIAEIKSHLLITTTDSKKIQKNIERVNKQLNELNNQLNKPANEVAVSISAKSSSVFSLELSYIVYDAGWAPTYNVRVEKINTPAQLNYIANVYQNSGFDWNDVDVVLSTRNPNRNNTKPELFPWYLDFLQHVALRESKTGSMMKSVAMDNVMATSAQQAAETMANYFETVETQLAVEFTPSLKYSIPSDNKMHSVALMDYKVKADYEYYAVPKLDNNAFLVAQLTDWGEFNLLPGEANIYFENSYVGKTYINPATTKDTLIVSLGRDENISVSREQHKDFTEDKFLSRDIERTFAYEIKVKNNKNAAVNLIVEEQIPISQQEDIVVKMIESSDGKYNQETGELKWNLNLESGKSEVKKLSFSVRHPKDKQIRGL